MDTDSGALPPGSLLLLRPLQPGPRQAALEVTNPVRRVTNQRGALILSGSATAGVTADPNNPLNVIASDGLGNTQSIPRSLIQSPSIPPPTS
jgi:hypothetical protein